MLSNIAIRLSFEFEVNSRTFLELILPLLRLLVYDCCILCLHRFMIAYWSRSFTALCHHGSSEKHILAVNRPPSCGLVINKTISSYFWFHLGWHKQMMIRKLRVHQKNQLFSHLCGFFTLLVLLIPVLVSVVSKIIFLKCSPFNWAYKYPIDLSRWLEVELLLVPWNKSLKIKVLRLNNSSKLWTKKSTFLGCFPKSVFNHLSLSNFISPKISSRSRSRLSNWMLSFMVLKVEINLLSKELQETLIRWSEIFWCTLYSILDPMLATRFTDFALALA